MNKLQSNEQTERIFGLAAALAALRTRGEYVLNIAHSEALRRTLAPHLREAARRRIAYREVDDEELARIAGSVHHEGICLLLRERPTATLPELARAIAERGVLVALDGVENPHNAGAVLRSAAFFGARGLVLADLDRPLLTPAAVRIAEGGLEFVRIARVPDLPAALQELRAHGIRVCGAEAHAEASLASLRWSPRTLLVLGSEEFGLSQEVKAACDVLMHIPGSGLLDSLNVSVAAGVLLASYTAAQTARSGPVQGAGRPSSRPGRAGRG